MKVLLCHNHYQQSGGEDRVFVDEGRMLEAYGHTVARFTVHNDAIHEMGRFEVATKTLWNRDTEKQLAELIERERPDVMHCTNVFPLISPAAYYVAQKAGVAVVQSLHNYRTICPKAQLVRNGAVCEKCLTRRIAWPAVVHACYRENRPATAAVVGMLALHWAKKTWVSQVDRYIALTHFSKQKHVQGGLPAAKIDVKPNFVFPDPGPGSGEGRYALFVGRLSPEKGVQTLLDAWSHVRSQVSLKIVGEGPLAGLVQQAAERDQRIEWLGQRTADDVLAIMGLAQCLIVPSICYETFGLAIVEAFATGTPVIASNQGAMAELVDDGRTGALFTPADAGDLAEHVDELFADAGKLAQLRRQARGEFEAYFTADANHDALVGIYERALDSPSQRAPAANCCGVSS